MPFGTDDSLTVDRAIDFVSSLDSVFDVVFCAVGFPSGRVVILAFGDITLDTSIAVLSASMRSCLNSERKNK